jgi:histone-lysine N-methyltransferase SETMAR
MEALGKMGAAPEAFDMPCCNLIDGEARPSGFEYLEHAEEPQLDEDEPPTAGCACGPGGCSVDRCPCARSNSLGQPYSSDGRLLPLLHGIDLQGPLWECGTCCACGGACACGVTLGRGALDRLRLDKRAGKGWCVVAAEPIAAATFVCEYAGEYVSRDEAARRLRQYDDAGSGHALLVLREWLPTGRACLRVSIDATRRGGAARFLNHR